MVRYRIKLRHRFNGTKYCQQTLYILGLRMSADTVSRLLPELVYLMLELKPL